MIRRDLFKALLALSLLRLFKRPEPRWKGRAVTVQAEWGEPMTHSNVRLWCDGQELQASKDFVVENGTLRLTGSR